VTGDKGEPVGRTTTRTSDDRATIPERAVRLGSHASPSGQELALTLQRRAGNGAVTDLLLGTRDSRALATLRRALSLPNSANVALFGTPTVMRDAREGRIRRTSREYVIPPGTQGCFLHLLLLIDAGRGARRLTTAGELERWRRRREIARGATVSDLVGLLKEKGIARESRWFSYPRKGRSFRRLKKLSLQGDPEQFVVGRVRGGRPAYFAVSFRNIHSGFILVTSTGQVLWLDQFGEKDQTGKLNGFLSRNLDGYVESNRKLHAWYAPTKITELRF
jgi:hypothetical protein